MTEFEIFFDVEWPKLLENVDQGDLKLFTSNYRIQDASWDRKAAFLLWMALKGSPPVSPLAEDNDFDFL